MIGQLLVSHWYSTLRNGNFSKNPSCPLEEGDQYTPKFVRKILLARHLQKSIAIPACCSKDDLLVIEKNRQALFDSASGRFNQSDRDSENKRKKTSRCFREPVARRMRGWILPDDSINHFRSKREEDALRSGWKEEGLWVIYFTPGIGGREEEDLWMIQSTSGGENEWRSAGCSPEDSISVRRKLHRAQLWFSKVTFGHILLNMCYTVSVHLYVCR